MDPIKIAIGRVGAAIRSNDKAEFETALDQFPWVDLDGLLSQEDDTLRWLVVGIIEFMRQNNQPQWLPMLFDKIDADEIVPMRDISQLSIKTQLYLLPNISIQTLVWLDQNVNFPTFVDMVTELRDWDQIPNLTMYLERMHDTVRSGFSNPHNVIVMWLNLTAPLGDQPWDLSNLNRPLMRWLVDLNIDPILPGDWALGWTIDKRQAWAYEIEVQLRSLTSTTFESWFQQLETNIQAQRIWGPFNSWPTYQLNTVPNNFEALMFMLQPMLYPHINMGDSALDGVMANIDDEGFEQDWFEGYCHQCFRGIEQREHALRQMLEHGGWSGCFCSWQCLVWHIPGLDLPEGYEIMSYEMIKVTAQRMTQISGYQQNVPGLNINI